MAKCVFVPPMRLLEAMFVDIQSGVAPNDEVEVYRSKVLEEAINGFQLRIHFTCHSDLVDGGNIDIDVQGPCKPGEVEAERECIMSLIEQFRIQHKLFPADYSLVVLCEKRAMFNAMKEIVNISGSDYQELSTLVRGSHDEVAQLCHVLSEWVGDNHLFVDPEDLCGVAEFQTVMAKVSKVLNAEIGHAAWLVEILMTRNIAPEALARLDETVPMNMEINWELSEHTLQSMCPFLEAVKKFDGASEVRVVGATNGAGFKACVHVAHAPRVFVGDLANSEAAARAKLYYALNYGRAAC